MVIHHINVKVTSQNYWYQINIIENMVCITSKHAYVFYSGLAKFDLDLI